jgi:hypothetical protein
MRYVCFCLALTLLTGVALGDDDVKPQDLKKLYNDALNQLKAAQDRKSELATQNQRMAMRAAELEKEIRFQTAQIEDLKRQAAGWAEKTYFLRTHYAAWAQFLSVNDSIKSQWDRYIQQLSPLTPVIEAPFFDMQWPLQAATTRAD